MTPEATTPLSGFEPAFRTCAGELGVWSAARLFVNAAWAAGGETAVEALHDDLGLRYPVVDDVARRVLTVRAPLGPPRVDGVLARCEGLRALVVVGVEAALLGPVFDSTFPVDATRVQASWAPRVRLADLASFQRAAGSRSALVTPVYGADVFRAVVAPIWVRAHGPEVRLQFRRLIGVNLVGPRMAAYPRWLIDTPADDFTDLVETV